MPTTSSGNPKSNPLLVEPTKILQRLYNRWRDAENHPLSEHLNIHQNNSFPLVIGELSDGGIEAAPGISETDDLTPVYKELYDEDNDGSHHHSRSRRRGPLPPVVRSRTAFMRKLGACKECKHRRVAVSMRWIFVLPLPLPLSFSSSRSYFSLSSLHVS
jgi:hypothetical protein